MESITDDGSNDLQLLTERKERISTADCLRSSIIFIAALVCASTLKMKWIEYGYLDTPGQIFRHWLRHASFQLRELKWTPIKKYFRFLSISGECVRWMEAVYRVFCDCNLWFAHAQCAAKFVPLENLSKYITLGHHIERVKWHRWHICRL